MPTNRPKMLTILHGNATPSCAAVVDKRFDGYASVQFMQQGRLRLSYDRSVHHLEGAWFWFAMPGPHIRFTTADGRPWHHRYLAFRGPLMEAWLKEGLIHRQPVPCPAAERNRFAWLMDEILGRLGADGRWAQAKTTNLLENLLIDIESLRFPHPARKKARLTEVVRLAWESAPSRPLDYGQLAARCGMAPSTFRRRFFQDAGVAVHRFVIRLRIERARQLLMDTDRSVEQVADALGFSDVFYFTRCFRAVVGLPPARYRRTRLSSAGKPAGLTL